MKHYVVYHSWSSEKTGGCGSHVLGIFHSLETAKRLFDTEVVNERRYAEEHGYHTIADFDTEFDAAVLGEYMISHTRLTIDEFEVEE